MYFVQFLVSVAKLYRLVLEVYLFMCMCRVCVLEDDDVACICRGTFAIYNSAQAASKVARVMETLEVEVASIMKGDFKHFMQKEIFQQPESLTQTMQGRLRNVSKILSLVLHQA